MSFLIMALIYYGFIITTNTSVYTVYKIVHTYIIQNWSLQPFSRNY